MARKAASLERTNGRIRGATLRPLRVVRRELVSPSGDVVEVEVPVYPPFRLESPDERRAREQPRDRDDAEGAAR